MKAGVVYKHTAGVMNIRLYVNHDQKPLAV